MNEELINIQNRINKGMSVSSDELNKMFEFRKSGGVLPNE